MDFFFFFGENPKKPLALALPHNSNRRTALHKPTHSELGFFPVFFVVFVFFSKISVLCFSAQFCFLGKSLISVHLSLVFLPILSLIQPKFFWVFVTHCSCLVYYLNFRVWPRDFEVLYLVKLFDKILIDSWVLRIIRFGFFLLLRGFSCWKILLIFWILHVLVIICEVRKINLGNYEVSGTLMS